MGLTKRQAALINQIISEDAQGVIAGRNARDGHLHRGKLLEEQLDEAIRIDPNNFQDKDTKGPASRDAAAKQMRSARRGAFGGTKEPKDSASGTEHGQQKHAFGTHARLAGATKVAGRHGKAQTTSVDTAFSKNVHHKANELDELESFDEGDYDSGDEMHESDLDEAEYGPKGIDPGEMEGRVNVNLLEKQIEDAFEDQMISGFDDGAWKLQQLIHKGVVKELFECTKKYGLGYTTSREVAGMLDPIEAENDDVNDAEMEFHGACMQAAIDYGKALARSLMKIVDRNNEDYEG